MPVENNLEVLLPDWVEQEPNNLYGFIDPNAGRLAIPRFRRVESIVPYRRRGQVVKTSSSSRPVQATSISASTGTVDVVSVQEDSTVSARRAYDDRSETRELTIV